MIVNPGFTAADEGKNDASTTNRFGMSWARQNGSSTDRARIGAEAQRAALVRRVLRAERMLHDRPESGALEDVFRLRDELLVRTEIVLPIREPNAAIAVNRDAVVVARQVFRHRQPVDGAVGPSLPGPHRDRPAVPRRLALQRHRFCSALRLNLPERIAVGPVKIEVVDRHRFLKHGRVPSPPIERADHRRVMGHVATADRARTSSPVRRDARMSPTAATTRRSSRRRTTRPPATPRLAASRRFARLRRPQSFCPLASVSNRRARAFVHNVTFGCAIASSRSTTAHRPSSAACRETSCTSRRADSRPVRPVESTRAAAERDGDPARAARRRSPPFARVRNRRKRKRSTRRLRGSSPACPCT